MKLEKQQPMTEADRYLVTCNYMWHLALWVVHKVDPSRVKELSGQLELKDRFVRFVPTSREYGLQVRFGKAYKIENVILALKGGRAFSSLRAIAKDQAAFKAFDCAFRECTGLGWIRTTNYETGENISTYFDEKKTSVRVNNNRGLMSKLEKYL